MKTYKSNGLRQSYPNAKNTELLSYYELQGNGNAKNMITELAETGLFEFIEEDKLIALTSCPSPEPPVNDPKNFDWTCGYVLEIINAYCAWSISKGSPDIYIGIADTDFEATHDDLKNKYAYIMGNVSFGHEHGTRMAGILGAETNNNLGVAGVGYKSKNAAHRIIHFL